MRILVISDTHRNLRNVYKTINSIENMIDAVIHCGDVTEDAETIRRRYPKLKVFNVRGNCDYDSSVPDEDIFILSGKRIFVTHGHMYGVNWNTDRLCFRAAEAEADVCLYGHTHIPDIENYGTVTIMNPGSISSPRGGSKCSYGIIKIEDGVVTATIVNV